MKVQLQEPQPEVILVTKKRNRVRTQKEDPHEPKILSQFTEEEMARIRKRERKFEKKYAWNRYAPRWLRFLVYIISVILVFWFALHAVINLVATDKHVHQEMMQGCY